MATILMAAGDGFDKSDHMGFVVSFARILT